MRWDESLLEEQRIAASHIGCHARLLAGPGTGKTRTLTHRVAYLVAEEHISPSEILVLTFTRAAAFELHGRISEILGDQCEELPRVSTLHSFALRQLLRNSDRIDSIPRPLRIADDWEERKIILEDLKAILGYDLRIVRERFNLLSADWQTLTADEEEWERRFPDPRFLGAWREHREIFSYTLRSELVYQLKRALEQTTEFLLESNYLYLLIDEYQDLNRCDLAVISAVRDRQVEIFAAGDDDQSIYGFRYAHPEGIRRFDRDYTPSSLLELRTCMRCDRSIIDLSLFVANLDPRRLEKPLECCSNASEGEVQILRFRNQSTEADGVAAICRYLLRAKGYDPKNILILVRSDRNRVFSSVLRSALEAKNVPVAVQANGNPLDTSHGRIFFSILRLLARGKDSDDLALRTLLMLRPGIGEKSCSEIYHIAQENAKTFSEVAYEVMGKPDLIPTLGSRISREMQKIQETLDKHQDVFDALSDSSDPQDLLDSLESLARDTIQATDERANLLQFLNQIVGETGCNDHKDLIYALSSSMEDVEQELDPGKVNIMTMHKAKGLTADAVIIVAAEDEYIPGRQSGQSEGDERRLLYVSLSRAKHFLVVTYCQRRTGKQRHTGRNSGQLRRTLTRFLRDGPVAPADGEAFAERSGYLTDR